MLVRHAAGETNAVDLGLFDLSAHSPIIDAVTDQRDVECPTPLAKAREGIDHDGDTVKR